MITVEELDNIQRKTLEEVKIRVVDEKDINRKNILVCGGTGCTSSKSPKIIEELQLKNKEYDEESSKSINKESDDIIIEEKSSDCRTNDNNEVDKNTKISKKYE